MTINFKLTFQIVLLVFIFSFATLATLYEGSNILDNPWEWKYSAKFSGDIVTKSDISQLDYFVYAIKFYPVFPLIMFFCGLYLLILTLYSIQKIINKHKFFKYSLLTVGVILLLFSKFFLNSPTLGVNLFLKVILSSGIALIMLSIFLKQPKEVDISTPNLN